MALQGKVAQVIVTEPEVPQTSEYEAKQYIYTMESSNNQYAVNTNSGACGLGQALPCDKMGCELSDYNCQDTFFNNYAENRYGGWVNAKQFWIEHLWW